MGESVAARVNVCCCMVCALIAGGCLTALAYAQSADYKFLRSKSALQDRIAYLLTVLEEDPATVALIEHEPAFQGISDRLRVARLKAFETCNTSTVCRVDSLMLSSTEIELISSRLRELAQDNAPLRAVVRDQLRSSGRLQLYANLDDASLLESAWRDTANAVNRLYRVYGAEQSYKIPNDGPSYSEGTQEDLSSLAAALGSEIDDSEKEVFFSPWSRLAFDLLIVNQRTEAIRYESLKPELNSTAFTKAASVHWSATRYSAILVPGVGLSSGERGVSATGEFLLRMAAKRWRDHLAPFIIVSGGHVHPNRTPYAEALEMKRLLIDEYGIPDDAIVVDPYARHTTTNVRNATRLLFHLKAPADQPLLITTTKSGADYVSSSAFAARCTRELGYIPATVSERMSAFDVRVRTNLASLQADPQDPLDP